MPRAQLASRAVAPLAGVASPHLKLAAAHRKEFVTHARVTGDALCPYRLLAGGFSFDAGKSVFPEHLWSGEGLVIWRYVVAGGFRWESGHQRVQIGAGMVFAAHQPTAARLIVAPEGLTVIWLLMLGAPAREYFDQIAGRFGAAQALAPSSPPVRLAEELVQAVRSGRARSPFFWSEHTYRFLSAWHRHLTRHRPPLHRLLTTPPESLRRHVALPRTVKSFAGQVGYSASHLTRQLAKRWKDTPGRLLRDMRLEEASRRLCHGGESVQAIAAHAGYASAPAFITAFKKAFGKTPLVYRREHR